MQNCKILSIVGARPNFMKIAPFIKAIEKYNSSPQSSKRKVEHILIHTGQHYDVRMSESFFKELGIPEPAMNLEIGSGSHAEQIGSTMIAFEKVIKDQKPDWVVVLGDVNATLACSVIAKKEGYKVCHIEAGLRSYDLSMPEEINRIVTDRLSDLLLTPDLISSENLIKEGIPQGKIRFVGNIMIDTFEASLHKASTLDLWQILKSSLIEGSKLNINKSLDNGYVAITIHRPSNVDKKEILEQIVDFLLQEVTKEFMLVWPVHPRTLKQLNMFRLWEKIVKNKNVVLLEPLSYHEMLRVTMGARIMMTDSGGLQEECCVLGIPCLTMRNNTERPITLTENGGSNILVGNKLEAITTAYNFVRLCECKPSRPALWDGHTAERCLEVILKQD